MSFLIPAKPARRKVLRGLVDGIAVSVALPFFDLFLDSKGKALAATGAPLPVRFGTWFWGLGLTPGHSVAPKSATGPGVDYLEECKPLERVREHVNFFGGFNTPLDGKGNFTHTAGIVASRTGTAASFNLDIPAPTLDVLIADEIGQASRFQSLDFSSIGISAQNYSGRNTNTRAAAEISPLAAFARIFGPEFTDPNRVGFKPDPHVLVRKSVLSGVREQATKVKHVLGAADRARMDEYFTSLRQLERQMELRLIPPPPNKACVVPSAPDVSGLGERTNGATEVETVVATHKLMTSILTMAIACDQTKIFNMVFSDNFSHMRRPGESMQHHQLTHEEPVDEKRGYQPGVFQMGCRSMEACADFIESFAKIREGDGTILDNTLIFASTDTNYARLHSIDGLPIFTAGKAGGRVKTGYHVVGSGDPITRVGLTAMHAMGLSRSSWGTKSLQTSKLISEILV